MHQGLRLLQCRAFEEGGAGADACRRAADGTVAVQSDALDAFQRDFNASVEGDQVLIRLLSSAQSIICPWQNIRWPTKRIFSMHRRDLRNHNCTEQMSHVT